MYKNNESFKIIVIIAAFLCMAMTFVFKGIGPLTGEALNTLGVLIGVLLLLIFDAFPIPITCLLAVVCLLIFRCVDSVSVIFSGYSNHILYFTFASFGITTALSKSSLTKRLLFVLVRVSNKTSKSILLMLMLCNAVLSSIVSNVAAVLLFIPIVTSFLQCYEKEEDVIKTKRTYMIGLMLSAMIGGMMTPAGSSINLLALNALEQYAGKYISFVQWMGVGIPTSFVIMIAAYLLLVLVFPPVEIGKDAVEKFVGEFQFGQISRKERYTISIVFGAVFLWILSSWIPAIHITVVAILALALLFLPKYGTLSWDDFIHEMSWETFFIAGTMITVANCVVESGLSDFILKLILPGEVKFPFIIVAALVAALTFVVMIFIPSAPASISILGPFVTTFAIENNYNPAILVMICGMCVSNCYLLPLDTPAMVIYSHKAFKMFDLPKVTFFLQCIVVIIMALLVAPLCRILNI